MDIKSFIFTGILSAIMYSIIYFLSYYMNKKNCPKEDILNVLTVKAGDKFNSYGFYY